MQCCKSLRVLGACLTLLVGTLLIGSIPAMGSPDSAEGDARLAAAKRFVEASDRYLHQSHLRPGMKGYGLTVLSGTERVRFDVEIVSVMTKWGPHQDVILARLSKQNLEKTGIIMGMSGSPCYVQHDGRDKLIGAVAFGYFAQKEPLCGIQPITQMLAISDLPGARTRPTSAPAVSKFPDFLEMVLDPARRDFASLVLPKRSALETKGAGPILSPLLTPLTVSGTSRTAIERLARTVRPMGMIPVEAGGTALADTREAEDTSMVPGGGVSVALVRGDADISAVGTVTEVVDDRVLAFGHAFFADGDVEFPMGPAYVHTVISGLLQSFKLGTTLSLSGTLNRDESVGVAGTIG
ncbi:MAG: SpoIVB peptidase S55 domain-containing protein, partial [Planctomycetota bacterium]